MNKAAPRPSETRGPSDGDGSQGATVVYGSSRGEPDAVDLSELGKIAWHSSEEDGGPDVGRSVGLGGKRFLWIGEISRRAFEEAGADAAALGDGCGTWLILYNESRPRGEQTTVIGKALDGYVGEDLCTAIAAACTQPPSPPPAPTPSNTVATPLDPASTPADPTSGGDQ